MKNIIILILCFAVGVSQAQTSIKINNFILQKGFTTDTATAVRIKCIFMPVDQNTADQRPVFYLELASATGASVDARNVEYQDMVNACVRNNIPENQRSATIAAVYAAVFCGTKAQKLSAIRSLMAGYGIVVKPDNEQ